MTPRKRNCGFGNELLTFSCLHIDTAYLKLRRERERKCLLSPSRTGLNITALSTEISR